jgi:hypothetical protein
MDSVGQSKRAGAGFACDMERRNSKATDGSDGPGARAAVAGWVRAYGCAKGVCVVLEREARGNAPNGA